MNFALKRSNTDRLCHEKLVLRSPSHLEVEGKSFLEKNCFFARSEKFGNLMEGKT